EAYLALHSAQPRQAEARLSRGAGKPRRIALRRATAARRNPILRSDTLPAMSIDGHANFMDLALTLGRRNLGQTWPNPAVGAVIVRDGEGGPVVVGRGWTQPGGRPHAEVEALARAGAFAR